MREGETYGSWVWAAESPRGATDQSGRVPKSAAQSSVGLKYLYASRPWSPVAEAYHNRARWYSPDAGRFLTREAGLITFPQAQGFHPPKLRGFAAGKRSEKKRGNAP